MRDSWGQNFLTKNGRKVVLTGCSRSSDTQAQWIEVRAVTDHLVPTWIKTLTRWTIWFWVKRIGPTLRAQTVKCDGRQAFLSHLLSASLQRICGWNAPRGDMHKRWLRRNSSLTFSGSKQLCFQKASGSFVCNFLLFLSSERIVKIG